MLSVIDRGAYEAASACQMVVRCFEVGERGVFLADTICTGKVVHAFEVCLALFFFFLLMLAT